MEPVIFRSALRMEGALAFMADLLVGAGAAAAAVLSLGGVSFLVNIASGSYVVFGVNVFAAEPDFIVEVRPG